MTTSAADSGSPVRLRAVRAAGQPEVTRTALTPDQEPRTFRPVPLDPSARGRDAAVR